MESANIHHHLQDQLAGSSSSSSTSSSISLATPSCYGVIGTDTHHHPNWTPIPILNTNGFTSYPNEPILSSRDSSRHQQEHSSTTSLLPSQYSSNNMAPDMAFHHWANSTNFTSNNIQSAHDEALQLSRIKEEFSDNYYLKYTELLNSSNSSSPPNDVATKLLLKSLSSGNLMSKNTNQQLSAGNHLYDDYGGPNSIGGRGFSQIFPSINVSSLNQTGIENPGSSLDMNLEALDLLASSRSFSGNFGPSPQNQLGLLRDGLSSYGFDQMQQQVHSHSSDKVSSTSSNGSVADAKRASRKMEPKAPVHQTAPKKSRLEARASCPPFKVRKEKLGDRIAALQQLVAPFGKTDTASVLMEAIGYIKFLQNQVETLSVPYMKTSRNQSSSRVIKGGPAENENEEQRRDLKSRGLCLVPLTCLSYITDSGGPAMWPPPPHFGGTT